MGRLKSYLHYVKNEWFIAVACFVFGVLVILGIRFITYKPDNTHYHANFALYINGQREEFKSPTYYEETSMCTADTLMTPEGRAHMHDDVNDVVHVEDHAVTWGQFFTNLGWYMGPNFIEGPGPNGTMHQENGNTQLHLIINGQDYTDLGGLQNTMIKDRDKLLVSFGDLSNVTLQQEYRAIPNTARHYDVTSDPKSCSGSRNETITFHDRITHLL